MPSIEYRQVTDYTPKSREKALNEAFRDERNNHAKQYKQIGNFATGVSYYKYFPIATAIRCLEKGTMALVEPPRWNDAYESLYYEADYSLVAPGYKDHPRVFATCATNQKYDEPAWRIYSGKDNICVQFELDRFQFRHALLKAIGEKDAVYEGEVQYASRNILETIGQRKVTNKKTGMEMDNPFYSQFIAHDGRPFGIENYMNLLLLKRNDFKHEQETRFFVIRHQDLVDEAEKATEKPFEDSDATERKVHLNRGEVIVLAGMEWVDILKGITINADTDSLPYRELKNTVNQLIDSKVKDPVLNDLHKKKLAPVPYLVYGTRPRVITIDK